ERFVGSSFERMNYGDAIKALEGSKKSFEFPVSWGMDLQSEHERWLTERHVGRPVVVMDYPKQIKAFYMRLNDDGRTVAAMDVLAPGIGEIIGGSQREDRLDVLDARTNERGEVALGVRGDPVQEPAGEGLRLADPLLPMLDQLGRNAQQAGEDPLADPQPVAKRTYGSGRVLAGVRNLHMTHREPGRP